MNWLKVVGIVLGAAVVMAVGLLVGHFGIPKQSKWVKELAQDLDEKFISQFMAEMDNKRIEDNLRILSKKPHVATSAADEELVQLLLSRWKDPNSGLDDAKEERYNVLLCFPDEANPNTVKVLNPSGDVLFSAKETEEELTEDQKDPSILQPFLAYAPSGSVKGKLVFANEGRVSDFQYLANLINLNGTIAIVRYGGIGRVNKAINAARFGVIGVIIYTDPKDINDGKSNPSDTYPHSWYLPPSGVERGSFKENFGDQLTPYYPAKDFTYRIPESEIKGISHIPAQPIGFQDARRLICELAGPQAQANWQGSLGCPYNIGPGFVPNSFSNSDVEVNVYNKRTIKSSANVMGIIRGAVEPDRYVMYGNHRDSWVHGAIDPSSGTAVMLEITRVLGTKLKQGKWRPRRTIIFGSWGAEEFGLIGSTEFAEDYYSKLRNRAVAYINVDISVYANATLRVLGTPPAQNVVFAASKQVKNPSNSLTVYENWRSHSNRTSPQHGVIPRIGTLGIGSDYAPFMHYLGITCMDIAYTYDTRVTSARIYPTYHTAFDTFDYTAKHIDPGFTSHQTVARTAGNVLLRLSDSLILPLGVRDYVETLESYYSQAESFQTNLSKYNISLVPLRAAITRYRNVAEALEDKIKNLKESDKTPYNIRRINDQLMLLERAFLNDLAFTDKLYFSHVLWASRTSSVVTFPGLADAYQRAVETNLREHWDLTHHHLTIAIQAVDNAASTLEEVANI
ncbi:PREDICTED: N-acetylated-alpha-linked acidic dipeptidase-like protein [Nanorana parkeri]|uniref:N-acetylated-alpha-linked acidic dipeptidase-like protein n=1 Tax=Nanorana parkeri TaxID=125878 RepID=UPI0008545A8D|nr:PREDICTED: N-acetylated-alpha-linked acidic dipeptidase-like protein [Nanorana parkeri]